MNIADQFETLEEIRIAVVAVREYIRLILEAAYNSGKAVITKPERRELIGHLSLESIGGLNETIDYLDSAISRRDKKGIETDNNPYPCPPRVPKLPSQFETTNDIRVSVQFVIEFVFCIVQKSVDSKALPDSGRLALIRWLTQSIGGILHAVNYLDSLSARQDRYKPREAE